MGETNKTKAAGTTEDVQAQITELSNKLDTVLAHNENLTKENAQLHQALEQRVADVVSQLKQGLGVNEIKTGKALKLELPEDEFVVEESEKADANGRYKFRLARFTYKPKGGTETVTITAVDALTDKAILQDLAERKSGAIVKVG